MEKIRAKYKTRPPGLILDSALLEVQRSQKREVPRCPGFERGITSEPPQGVDLLSSRELQVRGLQLFMKQPKEKGQATHLPLEEQTRARLAASLLLTPPPLPSPHRTQLESGNEEKMKE